MVRCLCARIRPHFYSDLVNTTRYTAVNNTQSTIPKKKTVGAIAGGAVGAAVVAVGLLTVGFLNAHNLSYFFNSLVRRLLRIKTYVRNPIVFFSGRLLLSLDGYFLADAA